MPLLGGGGPCGVPGTHVPAQARRDLFTVYSFVFFLVSLVKEANGIKRFVPHPDSDFVSFRDASHLFRSDAYTGDE